MAAEEDEAGEQAASFFRPAWRSRRALRWKRQQDQ